MNHIPKIFLAAFFIVASFADSNAQDYKRTYNWYFGDSAGLSFATDPPTVLTDGAMSTIEGCATMSDTNGNLLFYTNGVAVWNKNHQVMENGTGLKGHISSTQSSLIVPYPGKDSLYYIFTTDAVGQANGLQYSVVNMAANNGLGRITDAKNILLQTPVCEKLTATHHSNGKDIWVLAHGWGNNIFYSYLITSETISNCPIINAVGSQFSGNIINAQGSIKLSSDGRKLASCVFNPLQSKVELFSFNQQTGKVLFLNEITNVLAPYSVEFADENIIYVSTNKNTLLQYDLTNSDLESTKYQMLNLGGTAWKVTTIQRGIEKIYISYPDSSYLGLIENPNLLQSSSNFKQNGLQTNPKMSQYGLPNFVTSYFYRPDLDFTYTTNCLNDSVYFSPKTKGVSNTSWSIIKNKAILHTSSQYNTSFVFNDTGSYTVQLISGTDTVKKDIYIEPRLSLGSDTVVCNQSSIIYHIPENYLCIQWQDNADSMAYTITQSGKYHVSGYNIKGCRLSDTVNVNFINLAPPVITQQNDTLLTDSGNYSYQWYFENSPVTGNQSNIKVTKNGTYSVEITDSNGCTASSADFEVTGLGIQMLNATDYFRIYPVPASQTLFIEPVTKAAIENITLRDVMGRTYSFGKENTLQIGHLAKGIYFLEITDTQQFIYSSKILIN